MAVVVLPIRPGSDGDGRKWPKHHYVRNDDYYLDRLATEWIKDLPGGPQPGTTYRLDRLPQGYACFERQRPNTKHIDRYVYGHPRGQMRSLVEFYPHFKHLMDTGASAGCSCKHCSSEGARPTKNASGIAATSTRPTKPVKKSTGHPRTSGAQLNPDVTSESASPPKRKFADIEGTVDIYESLMRRLKESGPDESIDLPIEERDSPDWWTGYASVQSTLKAWQQLPRYAPRHGEVVLFARDLHQGETIAWDASSGAFKTVATSGKAWLSRPEWQAGVVTQLPDEPVSDLDLLDDAAKERSASYSAFRIEPLSEPGNRHKPWTKQSKHVPMHAIRPFSLLRECLAGVSADQWHATIHHALTVSSSFCVVGRYRFRGIWPHATVFSMGVYLGPESVTIGDAVRLMPRPREQKADVVTDIMVVTAIRLRFVNMTLEEDDDYAPSVPYHTCLHFSGRVYTLDPKRSYDRVGKDPVDTKSSDFPRGLAEYGTWYHYTDPLSSDAKIEVPFTRILGRCVEHAAVDAWFTTPQGIEALPSFRPINATSTIPTIQAPQQNPTKLSRGLQAVAEARAFSRKSDKRLSNQQPASSDSRQWFWADTRIEQLDLHEVNDRYVGDRHDLRTPSAVSRWRSTLKTLTGKNGALAAQQLMEKQPSTMNIASTAAQYGMVASSLQPAPDSDTAASGGQEEIESEDEIMVDAVEAIEAFSSARSSGSPPDGFAPLRGVDSMGVPDHEDDDEDDDSEDSTRLAGELAKYLRPGET